MGKVWGSKRVRGSRERGVAGRLWEAEGEGKQRERGSKGKGEAEGEGKQRERGIRRVKRRRRVMGCRRVKEVEGERKQEG
jgi:hypothetical protein